MKQGKVKQGIVIAALAAMAMTAGCVYTTVEDEFSLMWTRDDWRTDVFSAQLTEQRDGLDSAICDELQVRGYDEKERRKACQAAKNIAANRLPALKALRREMAAENVAKTKAKRKESMLQDVDDLMASIRDAARDIPVLTLVPCANPDGVAFMGFDFDSKIEWNERDHSIDDSVEDGWFLNLEYELKSPYHGFESVEARGDVKSRLPYALIFNRYVVCEFSIDEARKWADELMRDFAGDCGIRLAVTDGSSDWIQLEGKSETLRVWACAGAYSKLTFGRGEVQTEDGIQYQLHVRRLK